MADKLYTDSTVATNFFMWDKTKSEDKPEWRPHDAWLLPADIEEITLTVSKPDASEADEILTLSGGGVTFARAGEWRAEFDTDGGAGAYWMDWRGTTVDGKSKVSVGRVTARARPE